MRSRVPRIGCCYESMTGIEAQETGGTRLPLDSPSPIDSTSPRLSRWATPLETVGALRPESRTKSALEQGLYWRRRCNSPRTFDWRKCEGREGEDCTSVVKVLDIRFSRCLCEALMTPPSYPKYIKKLYKDLGVGNSLRSCRQSRLRSDGASEVLAKSCFIRFDGNQLLADRVLSFRDTLRSCFGMLGDLLDQLRYHDGIDWWLTDSSLHVDLVPPITAVPPPSLSLTKWRDCW